MEWEPWERTHQNCQEWTAWDLTDAWFVSVERRRLRWEWHMAYAPDDGKSLFEENGWCLTKDRAFAEAKAAAERARIRMPAGEGAAMT